LKQIKNMKKQILSALAVLAFAITISAQQTVTLRVDMNGLTVSPNGVHVAGSFQDPVWQPNTSQMVDEGGMIYSYTTTLNDGVYEYKFLNGNDWPDSENVPDESKVSASNGNRFFVVDGGEVQMNAIKFGGNAPEGGYLLRFTVDMSTSTVDAAGVFVTGDFQEDANIIEGNWTLGTTPLYDVDAGDAMDLYTGIYYVPAGTQAYVYKFLNGNTSAAYESVPATCSVSGNRTVTMAGNTTLKYCFSSCDANCVTLPTYNLTLNIDMNYNCGFDINSTDSVDVAGSFNGWSGGPAYLLSDDDNDGVYSITIPGVTSGAVTYKARIIRNGDFGNGWEPGGDNTIDLTGDLDAPVRCFGFPMGACAVVPDPSTVTFTVDMTDETPAANIYLIGSFTMPAWQGGAIEMQPTGAGIYSTTVADICPGKLNFKFVNGPVAVTANEESFPDANDRDCVEPSGVGGWNRVYIRPSSAPSTVAYKFNTCQEIVGIETVVSPIASMYPNPADQSTRVQFATENASYSVNVFDVLGKRVDSNNNVKGSYIIQRGNLTTGVYFVQVTDAKGNTATQKLIFR
jgi:hypothetical protein